MQHSKHSHNIGKFCECVIFLPFIYYRYCFSTLMLHFYILEHSIYILYAKFILKCLFVVNILKYKFQQNAKILFH